MKKLFVNFLCLFIPFSKPRSKFRYNMNLYSFRKFFVKQIKYDYIFSMGQACFVAYLLKDLKLRPASGPFDWMYGADFEKRFKIFISEFDRYFDKQDFEYIGIDKTAGKDIYGNKHTGLNYNHDFSLNANFDDEYKVVAEKYNRRIKRLLENIKNGQRILVVYIEGRNATSVDIETMKKLLKQANKVYQDKIDLAYIKHNPSFKPGKWKSYKPDGHLYLGEYYGARPGNEDANIKKDALIHTSMVHLMAFANLKK